MSQRGVHATLELVEQFAPSVLHVGKYYAPHPGGIETHLQHLVAHQSPNLAVEVLVANDHPATRTDHLDGAKIIRVARFGTLASQPLCPSLLWNLAGRTDSILHLHLPNPWAAQAYLMSGHKGKLVISHHADTLGRPYLRKLVDPFVRRAMHRAAAIIVGSSRYADSSQELAGFREKCHFIPYGIDSECFEVVSAPQVSAIHARFGSCLVLGVGRLVAYKGFEILIRAMREVDAALLLIGTGPLRERLERKIRDLKLNNRVHLLGHVDDALPYYKAARIFVLPSVSRAESFGIVQLEAMASGLPVINTRIDSGVPEVSLHGVTGVTVPPGDHASLAQAMQFLLQNEELRLQYGHAARVRAREKFSARGMVKAISRVYQSVL